MSPRLMTQSVGRPAAASREEGTGGRAGRGSGRTGGRFGDQGNGRIDGQGGQAQVGDQGRGQGNGRNQSEVMLGMPLRTTTIHTLGREVVVGMSWDNFKVLMREEFCPSNEMQKLETELWNHAMVGAGHAAYTDRFHELARGMVAAMEPSAIQKTMQIAGTLTDEALRNGSIKKNPEKRGNGGEPSKDWNGRDDNKRTRTGNAFATTLNPVRRDYTGTIPKCTTCNYHHLPEIACRTCFNSNCPGHFAKDCRVVPRNVNPINARNLTTRACYECGSTNHIKETYPRNNGNQARGMTFMLGAEEARWDPNIVTGIDWLSNHKAEIICHEKAVRIPLPDDKVLRVIGERPEEKMRHLRSVKSKEQKQGEIVVVRDSPKKSKTFDWGEEQENAFQTLQGKLCDAPVLALPDRPEDFVLKIHENNYTTHDLELGAVVFTLKIWRHYLYGTKSVIYTNHKSLQHTFSQKELNMEQRRWLELFSVYDCEIRYHPGKPSIKDRILKAHNEACDESAGLQKGLDEMIEHRGGGALYYLDRIWVPLKGDVRTLIMEEAHKSKYYVKAEHQRPSSLLQQPEIPEWKWEGIAMDLLRIYQGLV
ncbi:putative reverse transcriptase domain-containing protein, partial [Tanacetum coccineum]